jgi:hypothetical protein
MIAEEHEEILSQAEGDLSEISTVFSDSRLALEKAFQAGLPKDAKILTSSPALMHSGLNNVFPIESRLPECNFKELQRSVGGVSQDLFERALEVPDLAPFALTVARAGIEYFVALRKAACLIEADFTESRAFLSVDTCDPVRNATLNPIWETLLASNSKFQVFSVPIDLSIGNSPRDPGRFWRWQVQGPEYIGYRLIRALWRMLPLSLSRYRALILQDNELLWETAFHMGKTGVALRLLPRLAESRSVTPVTPAEDIVWDTPDIIDRELFPVIEDRIRGWVVPQGLEPCRILFRRQVTDRIRRQDQASKEWPAILDKLGKPGRSIVLVNTGATPEQIALAEVCRDRDIPVVAFQHGVTREINGQHHHAMAYYENCVSDLFFTHNSLASEISKQSPFARGVCAAVGLPRQYSRTGQKRRRGNSNPDLLFVSTNLYKGNLNMLGDCYVSDIEIASQEAKLIDMVLARLPHRVLYKPYPEQIRYSDPDPILEIARRAPNIEVHKDSVDTRYLLADHRVIISAVATSTTGWCLMSNKPYVFINQPDRAPLRGEARIKFEEGVFLFDRTSATFHRDLHSFLSQPLEAIEAAWIDKAPQRQVLIDEFFDLPGSNAGWSAAAFIKTQFLSGTSREEVGIEPIRS